MTRLLAALSVAVPVACAAMSTRATSQQAEKAEKPTLTFVLPGDSLDPAPRDGTVVHAGTYTTARGPYGFYWVRVRGYREMQLTRVPSDLPADQQLRDLRDSALAAGLQIRARARFFAPFACDTVRSAQGSNTAP